MRTVLLFLPVFWAAGCGSGSHPNLLFISIDTTRADHIGAYGREGALTPVIDQLASEGFLFRKHLTPVPLTLPAHTSMFTGLYPPQHGVRDNGSFVVPEEAMTLAEVLGRAGYDTSAFVASFPLAGQFGMDQGFDHYDDDFSPIGGTDPLHGKTNIFYDERPAASVVNATLDYLRTDDSRGPKFTFVHFFDPHQPLRPPPPFDLDFRANLYDGEIAYVDEQIGRLISGLKQLGQWDNTVVVITSDHGEGLGEHGELTHSMLLHQATLHVPLIVSGPGVPQGETFAWSSATQLFETLLELLDLASPDIGRESRSGSLMPLIRGDSAPPSGWPPFTSYFETIAPRSSQGAAQLTGWMEGDWRMVHAPRPELYDLASDPRENRNLANLDGDRVAEMFAELKGYLERNETLKISESALKSDPEVLQRLRGLGYVHFDQQSFSKLNDMLDVAGLVDPKDRVVDVSQFSEAKAAFAQGDLDAAFALHKMVLERTPTNVSILRGMALLLGEIGNWGEALAYLDRAIAANPADFTLVELNGQLLIEMGRVRLGVDTLQALPNAKESIELMTWIGVGLARLDEYDQALDWFERGLAQAPEQKWLRLYLANHLARGNEPESASPHYRKLIGDHPYFGLAYYNFGKLMYDLGRPERARALFDFAARLSPHHRPTRLALQLLDEKDDE